MQTYDFLTLPVLGILFSEDFNVSICEGKATIYRIEKVVELSNEQERKGMN